MIQRNQIYNLEEYGKYNFTFSFCNSNHFLGDYHFRDTRSTARLFIVLNEGKGGGFVSSGDSKIQNRHSPKQSMKNGNHIELKTGVVVIIPCDIFLTMHFPNDMVLLSFHFNAFNLLGQELFKNYNKLYCIRESEKWITPIQSIFNTNKNPARELSLRHLLISLCFDVAADENLISKINDPRFSQFENMFVLLESRPPAAVTIADLAAATGKEISTLSKSFKKQFQMTLKDFLTARTVTFVKNEIVYTAKSMREISNDAGFADEFYFSKFVKKHTGLSPSHLREQNLEAFSVRS